MDLWYGSKFGRFSNPTRLQANTRMIKNASDFICPISCFIIFSTELQYRFQYACLWDPMGF